MSLKETLMEHMKVALKAKDQARLSTVRMLLSAVKSAEIDLRTTGATALTEEQELALLQKQAKQRRDAIEQFQAGGRTDLAEHEAAELAIIEAYLPAQMTDEDLEAEIRAIMAETGISSAKEMGKLMKPVMEKLRGKADGRRIQSAVKTLLQ